MIKVAPFAGAWIEIQWMLVDHRLSNVAPFAGAWIEIKLLRDHSLRLPVAPFAGAWIEISSISSYFFPCKSHPSRVRGLK